jgi:mercuric ion transport protein
MWRDRWFVFGVVGAVLSCLACLTPVVVLALAAVGLGAWSGHLDTALLLMLLLFAGLAFFRYRVTARRAP